jgi:hypothetical protein
MERACGMHGVEEEFIYRILVEKLEGKRQGERMRWYVLE